MHRLFSKPNASVEPDSQPVNVSKQVGMKVTVSLVAEAIRRVLVELGFPWF